MRKQTKQSSTWSHQASVVAGRGWGLEKPYHPHQPPGSTPNKQDNACVKTRPCCADTKIPLSSHTIARVLVRQGIWGLHRYLCWVPGSRAVSWSRKLLTEVMTRPSESAKPYFLIFFLLGKKKKRHFRSWVWIEMKRNDLLSAQKAQEGEERL